MAIKNNELRLQNDNMTVALKSQEARVNSLELKYEHLRQKHERVNFYVNVSANGRIESEKRRLERATLGGDNDVVRLLLALGWDVNSGNSDNWTPLHWAMYTGDLEMTKLLLKEGADINAKTCDGGLTPLHFAAKYANREVGYGVYKKIMDIDPAAAAFLIQNGAEVNVKDDHLNTPLHSAMITNKII